MFSAMVLLWKVSLLKVWKKRLSIQNLLKTPINVLFLPWLGEVPCLNSKSWKHDLGKTKPTGLYVKLSTFSFIRQLEHILSAYPLQFLLCPKFPALYMFLLKLFLKKWDLLHSTSSCQVVNLIKKSELWLAVEFESILLCTKELQFFTQWWSIR